MINQKDNNKFFKAKTMIKKTNKILKIKMNKKINNNNKNKLKMLD